jgi:rod shape-determining protein MreC
VRNQKSLVLKVLVVIALVVFLGINSGAPTSTFRINLMDLFSSPLKVLSQVKSFLQSVVPFHSLREENKDLRGRIDMLNRKIETYKVIQDENDRLKSFMNFRKAVPYAVLPAQVIGRDPSNWSNSLIIDKGASQGVGRNRAVISTRGLVGRVVELGNRSAKVLLITDPNSKVGVIIQRNRQGGILVGRPDGKCRMIYIALDSDVAIGDRVLTAGLGSIFPKDILVGEVLAVDKEPGRLYKYAVIKTSEDLSRLEEVLCLR